MSLKNETQSLIHKSKYYVDQYTEGMTRERINIAYKADRMRLQKLYHDTVVTEQEHRSGEEIDLARDIQLSFLPPPVVKT